MLGISRMLNDDDCSHGRGFIHREIGLGGFSMMPPYIHSLDSDMIK